MSRFGSKLGLVMPRAGKPLNPYPYPDPGDDLANYQLMTPEEVAKLMRISKTGVYRLVESRVVPFYRVGGVLRFRKQDLIAYLKSKRTNATNWHL